LPRHGCALHCHVIAAEVEEIDRSTWHRAIDGQQNDGCDGMIIHSIQPDAMHIRVRA
jgi:hypothetical protein